MRRGLAAAGAAGGGSAGSWRRGGCCGRACVAGAGAWRGRLVRRSVLRASLVQRVRPVWAGRAGPGQRAGVLCWLALRGGCDTCGRAAWTGHASPAVRALQSRPIDDTNPRCSAAEVARFRSLRRPPPHRHRRGRHPAGSFPPAVALLHQKPLPSQHRNKAPKPVCSSTCCVRLSVHWSPDLVILSRIPPCGCRRARRSDTPGIGGGVFMATMVGGGASS